jgi:hypothetical protein
MPKEPPDSEVIWAEVPASLVRHILKCRINGYGKPVNIIRFKKPEARRGWVEVNDDLESETGISKSTICDWVYRGLLEGKGFSPMKVKYSDLKKVALGENL